MTDPSNLDSHLRLALAAIPVFANDGRLDLAELDKLLAIALHDDHADDEEKRVLAGILRRAEDAGVDTATGARIAEVRAQLGLAE